LNTTLSAKAKTIAGVLVARKQTIAVCESSSAGLVSAALLSVPGASAYFLGGAVVYTKVARETLLGIAAEEMRGIRSASEPYAALLARTVRERFAASWGIAETGAAGPSGNGYGDPAGHTCLAVNGARDAVRTVRTGFADRERNMDLFAEALLDLMIEAVQA